jgi:hypothetical protein
MPVSYLALKEREIWPPWLGGPVLALYEDKRAVSGINRVPAVIQQNQIYFFGFGSHLALINYKSGYLLK